MFKMMRQEQYVLLALKMQMKKDLLRARTIDFLAANDEIVTIRSSVMAVGGNGKKELSLWPSATAIQKDYFQPYGARPRHAGKAARRRRVR
jgi:hypothetical protein